MTHLNVSRQKIETVESVDEIESLGASYTHIKSLKNVIGPQTKKIVMYHAYLETMDGFEDTNGIELAYLGFNRISSFRPQDATIPLIKVFDLAGNPLKSLVNCPPVSI